LVIIVCILGCILASFFAYVLILYNATVLKVMINFYGCL